MIREKRLLQVTTNKIIITIAIIRVRKHRRGGEKVAAIKLVCSFIPFFFPF